MVKKTVLSIIAGCTLIASLPAPAPAQHGGTPTVLPIRERAALVQRITAKRLDTLIPRMMRETGFDMWIVSCNEDNLDPVFETMIPYE
ncbi:MAG: Xaa-Pro aminopeptidase, partial [Candidatus Aminicenantes bacterium]